MSRSPLCAVQRYTEKCRNKLHVETHGEGKRLREVIAPNLFEKSMPGNVKSKNQWLAMVLMAALSFWIFYALVRRSASDLSIHATWAAEGMFTNPRTFFHHGAHPLWHVLVAFVMRLGVPVKVAAALVTAFLKTAVLWATIRLMTAYFQNKYKAAHIAVAAFSCMVASALWLPEVNPLVYVGVGSPNPWHSPTQMAALAAMLLCVPYTAHCYAEFERLLPLKGKQAALPLRKEITLGLLLLLSLAAKPTFMQAFLPAAGIYFGVQWLRHPQNSRFFWRVLLAVMPAILLMVLQYLYYFGIIVPSQGNMILELSTEKLGRGVLVIALIEAFPLYVLATCGGKKLWKDPLMALTVLLNGMGVLEYLLLGEDGRRASDGNFGWGMMGSALMLWIMMMIHFGCTWAKEKKKAPPAEGKHSGRVTAKYACGLALLLWHVGSGIYYIVYLLGTGNAL